MNRENFAEYLRNPSRLYQLSYAELKSLVLEYPYSPNLRLLLLLKARLENDPRAAQILESTAAHAFDRAHLFRLLRQTAQPAALRVEAETEEVLELKALTELDAQLERLPAESRPTNDIARALHFFPDIDLQEPEPEDEADEPVFPLPSAAEPPPAARAEPEPVVEAPLIFHMPLEVMANATAIAALDALRNLPVASSPPELPVEEAAAPDLPERTDPLKAAVELAAVIAALPVPTAVPRQPAPEVKTEPPPPPPAEPAPTSARSSRLRSAFEERKRRELARLEGREPAADGLTGAAPPAIDDLPFGVASETLARVLVEQGNYDRAETMYRELSLLFPEKSPYFAAIIEELKQKR